MKRVILCPNPYRDNELTVAKRSRQLLEQIGFETVVCLPFSRAHMPLRLWSRFSYHHL